MTQSNPGTSPDAVMSELLAVAMSMAVPPPKRLERFVIAILASGAWPVEIDPSRTGLTEVANSIVELAKLIDARLREAEGH